MAVLQNAATASYNPSKWRRRSSTSGPAGGCSTVYDADTAAAALTADTSTTYNASNAASGGASGFSHDDDPYSPLCG